LGSDALKTGRASTAEEKRAGKEGRFKEERAGGSSYPNTGDCWETQETSWGCKVKPCKSYSEIGKKERGGGKIWEQIKSAGSVRGGFSVGGGLGGHQMGGG